MNTSALCHQLLTTAREMNHCGLNQGCSGNVSVRHTTGMLITPSAVPYEQCTPEDMVGVSAQGEAFGGRKPSSEWRMHQAIYQRFSEAGAILHAHSSCCTTLACLQRSIPPFHYMVALAGGSDIRCAPYALFGTQELSDVVLEALQGRKAALMAHHGMICFAANLEQVLPLAIEVESLARMYMQILQIEEPLLLNDAQMSTVLDRFRTYRQ